MQRNFHWHIKERRSL